MATTQSGAFQGKHFNRRGRLAADTGAPRVAAKCLARFIVIKVTHQRKQVVDTWAFMADYFR